MLPVRALLQRAACSALHIRHISAPATTLAAAAAARTSDTSLLASLASSAASTASSAPPSSAVESLLAVAQLGVITDESVVGPLLSRVRATASELDAPSVSAAAWAAAALEVTDAAVWDVLRAAVARVDGQPTTPQAAAQLLAAELVAPTPLLSEAAIARLTSLLPPLPETPSPAATDLAALVAALGYQPQRVTVNKNFIDAAVVVLATGLGKTVIELDGPAAFLAGASLERATPTGETRMRTRVLRALGFSVVRVPFYEWAALETDTTRKMYLAAKIMGSPVWDQHAPAADKHPLAQLK